MVISQKEMPCVFFLSPPSDKSHFNHHCPATAVALRLSKRQSTELFQSLAHCT
jgi:hypothetical protein